MSNSMDERYEGNFFDALELPEGELLAVTIEHVADPNTERDSAKKPITNAILSFTGQHKRLIINRTNYKNLKAMFGKDPAGWIGRRINIQRRYLDAARGFGQINTLCVRIVPPIGTPILKSAANFMGQPHPYHGEQAERAKKAESKAAPKPEPKPESTELTAAARDAIHKTPLEKLPATISAAFSKEMADQKRIDIVKAIIGAEHMTIDLLKKQLRPLIEDGPHFETETKVDLLVVMSARMDKLTPVPQ